ncbi:MAG TPA: ATP-binding protein [Acetivibrio sp.]|uniref:ATP-binding protein n=1 Tax=Acetivibrio sp. TaxID=1872092 RepID=UPI002D1D553D|nr:ATP-binding protein [Acetivibrio sp.]HOM02185.1 ATP-binding protein [Acetivibrio sp.]
MSDGIIRKSFVIPANDFTVAGEASSSVKKMLIQLGADPHKIKKTAISMYEAELNAVIHANGGVAEVEIDRHKVFIRIKDEGPGIPDLELAMQEGYTTAPDSIREMGFGAGMGLPNMKRYADKLEIATEVGKGTVVEITVFLTDNEKEDH